jgi:arabinan endo-1,5-alpha-L-arabinosidase
MPRKYTRRQVLRTGAVIGASVGLTSVAKMQDSTPETTPESTPESTPSANRGLHLTLTGAFHQIHDPSIIKGDDAYYVFCTGNGIPVHRSVDLLTWEIPFIPSVFSHIPDWAIKAIPGASNIWAPDISYYNGKYHLYYAVSTFGSNRSVIGLATNKTLDFKAGSPDWVDEGLVIESHKSDDHNCIDPNLILDADGTPWLAFGSFWTGIKMRRLDAATGKLSADDDQTYSLARRPDPTDAIEAAFIIRKGDFYYLFASYDFCCRGAQSTYNVRVGRAEHVTGPYADKDGVAMLDGGGTQITFPTDRWKGPGHNGILQDNGVEYIVYHAYDADNNGVPTMRIDQLVWDADGWPSIPA